LEVSKIFKHEEGILLKANFRELKSAFDYLGDHSKCRAIVLSANGPLFCAGIDLKDGIKVSQAG
jgi:enoyl-CoA hydratase/carnithine racemase